MFLCNNRVLAALLFRHYLVVLLIILLLCSSSMGRITNQVDERHLSQKSLNAGPAWCRVAHNIGKIKLAVNNYAQIGWVEFEWEAVDCLTGEPIYLGCEYPKDWFIDYIALGAYWIGAVVGSDTLVSVGHDGWNRYPSEFAPDIWPFGQIKHRSIFDPDLSEFEYAVSEQDFIAVFSDTATEIVMPDFFNSRPHIPLNIEIKQKSFAWSNENAEDFVLFDLGIRNIGDKILNQLYIGLYIDGDIGVGGYGYEDDLCGFLKHVSSPYGCGFVDTLNFAWTADNDGNPIDGEWLEPPRRLSPDDYLTGSTRAVTGVTFLRAPSNELKHSFNWWFSNFDIAYEFGPMRNNNIRDFRTGGIGSPMGDVNKYFLLSNKEFDYDQAFTAALSPLDTTWLYPNQEHVDDWTDGFDTRYLLSFGPFTVHPGQTLPLTYAYVAGENFHNDVNNLTNLQPESYDPIAYYRNLDFSDLAKNTMWAQWIYDNPGYDSDNDGYFGEFRVCVYDSMLTDTGWVISAADTQWYRGDGVPDFRGAAPPPAPYFWVTPLIAGLHIRFNGERSETEKDIFMQIPDFEGYRIYFGRDTRSASLALIASYDNENYNKYVFNSHRLPFPGWELYDIPYTLDSLRCLYGRGINPCNDSTFDPLDFTPGNYYRHHEHPDSLFYFVAHDYNTNNYETDHSICKRFPDQRDPREVSPVDLNDDDYTEDGYLKFFEYEYTIRNLLPTVPYWVNVTAFDFGLPKSDLASLETSKTVGPVEAYPFNSESEAAGTNDKIYIYPNPYRIDGDYRAHGFEGRNEIDRPDYRVRAIHFTNLPAKCTIRIHSLDGDLVRELKHDIDPSLPTSRDHEWDLVTRNTQMIVTGLYYWTVESPDGSIQMGKLVILM